MLLIKLNKNKFSFSKFTVLVVMESPLDIEGELRYKVMEEAEPSNCKYLLKQEVESLKRVASVVIKD